jgi:hypothetical protein
MVPAVVFDGTAAEAELWRIGENLMRKELTDLERAEQIARRIGLTEEQKQTAQVAPPMRIVTTKGKFAKSHANSVLSGARFSAGSRRVVPRKSTRSSPFSLSRAKNNYNSTFSEILSAALSSVSR